MLKVHNSQSRSGVAYFYFDSNNASKRRPDSIVKSLLTQLSAEHLPAFEILKEYHASATRKSYFGPFQGEHLTTDSLLEIFKPVLEAFGRVFIIIDALDECIHLDELVKFIDKLTSWKIAPLSLLATSRQHKLIEEMMNSLGATQVILDSSTVGTDIQTYVDETVTKDPYFKRWPHELRLEIRRDLINGANGM